MQQATIEMQVLLSRVQSEFREMPGLRLTGAQARRLFGLDPQLCEPILRELVEAGFLTKTGADLYARCESVA
jgi:hypothetical protein